MNNNGLTSCHPYGSTTKCNRAVWSHTVVCGSMVASLLNSSTGCSNMRQKCTRRLWIHQAISGSMCSFWMLEPMEPQAPLRLHNISYPFLGFEPWSHGQCSGSIQFWVQWEEFRWFLTLNRKHEKAFCFQCNLLFGVMCWGNLIGS